ncbi:MAG: hypothetical protein HY917_03840 [Candidatus Diapherotrites archaeon]|nr:hypothetical protein [Candidatus Diapherotrites archaeon]
MYVLVFDEVILKQLKKLARDYSTKRILSHVFNRIEERGPLAGKLLDPQLSLYEVKIMRPPLRIYYKIVEAVQEAHVFEYEVKTSQEKQDRTITRLRGRLKP